MGLRILDVESNYHHKMTSLDGKMVMHFSSSDVLFIPFVDNKADSRTKDLAPVLRRWRLTCRQPHPVLVNASLVLSAWREGIEKKKKDVLLRQIFDLTYNST